MLWTFDSLKGFTLHSRDGRLGSVHDVLFDDRSWEVRYLVVDTGWIFGRRVLLVPSVLGEPSGGGQEIPVELSTDQVKNSPSVDSDQPVSRQEEAKLHAYYGWAPYWTMSGVGGLPLMEPTLGPGMAGGASDFTGRPPAAATGEPAEGADEDSRHLRSAREVIGYTLAGTDGDIGSVDDMILDAADWKIRWIVVDTGSWLTSHPVVISPDWVREVDWPEARAFTTVPKAKVEGAPAYEPGALLTREREQEIYDWHGQRPYW